MDEEEAKLLAELKAISSGTDRFQSDEPIADTAVRTTLVDRHSPSVKKQQRSNTLTEESSPPPAVLPWKKKKEPEKKVQPQSLAAPSTFQGARGGAAEDPELLALLRGVSTKSSASRFDDDEELEAKGSNVNEDEQLPDRNPTLNKVQEDKNGLPPWKRSQSKREASRKVSIIEETAESNQETLGSSSQPSHGIKSGSESTFKGERGGTAQDAELLALLRGVSEKAGASRFDDEDSDVPATTLHSQPKNEPKAKPSPPWKTPLVKKTEKQNLVEPLPDAKQNDPSTAKVAPGGIKSTNQSAFKGERGGEAQDPELLALLRGVSAKAGSSRFDDGDSNEIQEPETTPPLKAPKQPKARPLPPWKKNKASKKADLDVVLGESAVEEIHNKPQSNPQPRTDSSARSSAAGDSQNGCESTIRPQYGIKSDIPSTFKGERGGSAQDAELLALLRGVSAKAGASRFDDGSSDPLPPEEPPADEEDCSLPSKTAKQQQNRLMPPWKKNKAPKDAKSDVVGEVSLVGASIGGDAPQPQHGIRSDIPSTFQGERGGTAEDPELLALLRGVSAQSGPSRFDVDDQSPGDELVTQASETLPNPEPPKPQKTRPMPPWKRSKAAKKEAGVPSTATGDSAGCADPTPEALGIKPDIASTFKGERGGTAQDPELLALLRGVSSASGASRFDGDVDTPASNEAANHAPAPGANNIAPKPQTRPLPPWKRNGVSNSAKAKVSKRKPWNAEKLPESQHEANEDTQPSYGIKSDIPSTFSGERGGKAEDEELLALLREVSSKSSVSKFDENIDSTTEDVSADVASSNATKTKIHINPPWKRKSSKHHPVNEVAEESHAPHESCGIKPEIPSTFQGDRGGSAQDPELLALLRGVSTKSSSGRFEEGEHTVKLGPSSDKSKVDGQYSPPKTRSAAMALPDVVSPETEQNSEKLVTVNSLPEALLDKNWKMRAEAYELLEKLLRRASASNDGLVRAEDILPDLDEKALTFGMDSSAPALDKALSFLNLYADRCEGAGSAEQAAKIVSSLLKKNALSSRPATLRFASSLVLKLMEVGLDGTASVHSVVQVLLDEGITSKKPKVVQAAVSLILDGALHFGAFSLPLASIVSGIPKVISNSNEKVRKNGLLIIAELCRTLGSKTPIQGLFDGMKPAQVSEIDSMLQAQPKSTPVKTGLRNSKSSSKDASKDALAVLHAGSEAMEAQQFAARPAVDVVQAVKKTDYAKLLDMPKWSNKVAALDIVIRCGGEKPFKLAQPSNSISYVPLIGDMRGLLGHTHFAVVSKALQVLSMLGAGVGEKLFPYLRPLLGRFFRLAKDKKLTRAVNECLDSLYGNVLSLEQLLDGDDALPDAVDEKKQKNELARKLAMEFLARCITRSKSAGPKGLVSVQNGVMAATLCCHKLNDPDASVRKVAMTVLSSLQSADDRKMVVKVQSVVETLKTTNPRAYKNLSKTGEPAQVNTSPNKGSPLKGQMSMPLAKTSSKEQTTHSDPPKQVDRRAKPKPKSQETDAPTVSSHPPTTQQIPHLEDALIHITSLAIPKWDDPEDDAGVLAGLKSSKWHSRQAAITALSDFIASGQIGDTSMEPAQSCTSIVVVVKEQTKDFKETNINVLKAIIDMLCSVCRCSEALKQPIPNWIASDCAKLCVQKIADKKLGALCRELLSLICAVSPPPSVVQASFEAISTIKSPVAHEELLKWFRSFCNDFGVGCIGSILTELVPKLVAEYQSTNVKVKREALSCFGELHRHLGPSLKAITLSKVKEPVVKENLVKCFEGHPHDASLRGSVPNKSSLCSAPTTESSVGIEVPKSDLFASLTGDVIVKLASKDGKTSWKMRKEAMEEIDSALKACNGTLQTGPQQTKQLVELLRGLRDRLSDTQINLRPTAARIIGSILSVVDTASQAKLGKIVYAPLLSSAMNDIKKQMRDASLHAIRASITAPTLDGGGLNKAAIEGVVSAFSADMNDSAVRALGLPDVLRLLVTVAEKIPNLEDIAATRGQKLSEKYASALVVCLTSSKSETRTVATTLLETAVTKGTVEPETFKKATGRLKPALQRSIGPLILKFTQNTGTGTLAKEKENQPTEMPPSGAMPTRPSRMVDASTSSTRSTIGEARRLDPTSDDVGQRRVVSANTKQRARVPSTEPNEVESSHPFASGKNYSKIPRPLFPDEPSASYLSNLKRSWGVVLPSSTSRALFPPTGVRKQDDAHAGCELLMVAIGMDRCDGVKFVVENVEDILSWLSCALCSKESTSGLQGILDVSKSLFTYLIEQGYELTDTEGMCFTPFLIEKSSNAKGRFCDEFDGLVQLLENHGLLTPKQLGSLVCVTVFESSTHVKARALACDICRRCVEIGGLAAISKRGVLASASFLSNEPTKYRSSALNLLCTVVSKMNGDAQKLFRICGASLSDKARESLQERLIEERGKASVNVNQRRDVRPTKLPGGSSGKKKSSVGEPELYSELPKLSLRSDNNAQTSGSPKISGRTVLPTSNDPFTFAFEPTKRSLIDADANIVADSIPDKMDSASGAAATLRARLQRIRDKGKPTDSGEAAKVDSEPLSVPTDHVEIIVFEEQIKVVYGLLERTGPIDETDKDLVAGMEVLKLFHGAFSEQQYSTSTYSMHDILQFRGRLIDDVDTVVDIGRRMIGFSFRYGDPKINGGILLPLLSLCLAALMALFKDDNFARHVSTEELSLLIREAGTALLSDKLSSTEHLSEETGTQMVRAINKLAVQAATTVGRHTSFQALLAVQQQLFSKEDEATEFNSRLSRVVTKLFARVIRAEEASDEPFNKTSMDLEALICTMEDTLNQVSANDPCYSMIQTLAAAILNEHVHPSQLRSIMSELDIDPFSSALGRIIAEWEGSEAGDLHVDIGLGVNQTRQPGTPSKDVAALVSRLGSAPEGEERSAALEAIKRFKQANGDEDLKAHLQQLSGPFREFIEEQLGKTSPSKLPVDSGSVSERIRSLRTRLQANEGSKSYAETAEPPPVSETNYGTKIPTPLKPSGIPKSSPSKLQQPVSRTAQSLRDRLAIRKTNTVSGDSASGGARAAALRARLEAVKQQANQKQNAL